MLTVSLAVVNAFSAGGQASFDHRACEFLSSTFPDLSAAVGSAGLYRRVVDGQNRATLAGCRSEREIMIFLTLQAMLGEYFDIAPNFAPYTAPLFHLDRPISERLEQVLGNLTGEPHAAQSNAAA